MRPSHAIAALWLSVLGLACGPDEPGPTPTVFVDASVEPTHARTLSSCESACRRLQELHCPKATAPRGDCRKACKDLEGLRLIGAEPGCILDAKSCEEVERCQGLEG